MYTADDSSDHYGWSMRRKPQRIIRAVIKHDICTLDLPVDGNVKIGDDLAVSIAIAELQIQKALDS